VTITPRRIERIMGDAIHELHQQSMRSHGQRMAHRTLDTARTWRAGPRSGLGNTGTRSSDVSDPTGATVIRFPDPGDRYLEDLTRAWHGVSDAIKTLHDVTAGIHARADKVTRQTNSHVRLCAVEWCKDDIILTPGQVPERGRCEPCADYHRRHGEDPPPATVSARRRKREQREREQSV